MLSAASATLTGRQMALPMRAALSGKPLLVPSRSISNQRSQRSHSRCPVAASASFRPAAETKVTADALNECCLPPTNLQRVIGIGVMKAGLPAWKVVLLGLLAGAYVGFGAVVMLNVGAQCPALAQTNPGLQKLALGAIGLPFGLVMVLVAGAELFTGNTCMLAAALYARKITGADLAKNWILSWTANLAGGALLAWTFCAAGVNPPVAVAAKVAVAKTSLPFIQALLRGILANWLVNIAVWMATASTSVPGKVVSALIPVITFVSCGLEHSVANMFFIPLGIFLGAEVTWRTFLLKNLLPVTIGNIIGGAVLVAGSYSLAFGNSGDDN